MTPDPPPPEWVLVLRPEVRDQPAEVRVRRLLKFARELGLKCVLVRDATPAELAEAAEWLRHECGGGR